MTTITPTEGQGADVRPAPARTAPTHPAPARENRPRRRRGPSVWLAAPALALFGLFAIVPLLGVLVLSFMTWDGLASPSWTGLDNWRRAVADPVVHNAFYLTVKVTVFSWLIQAPVSLLLGVFMAGRQRYRAVLSVLYFFPLLFSAAAVGIAFKSLLDPNFGVGAALGLPWLAQDWLGDPDLALWVVLFVIAWCFVPFHSLLYQAGVRQIPTSLYEAARLDRASTLQQFFLITIPQLKYTIITSSTLIIVGSLTYFDLIFVLTGGGPGNATRILPLHMYLLGFRSYDMGGASVVGVFLVAVGLTVSLVLNKLSGANKMESQMEGM
ncbi:MAG TPA: sugar ABC transporter permease [Arachnia sp.]|nr:sugar ABC transporter permease [Arachnia sp.]HMT85602.1 sugar ABC transporter permease [Arachnia sp.]